MQNESGYSKNRDENLCFFISSLHYQKIIAMDSQIFDLASIRLVIASEAKFFIRIHCGNKMQFWQPVCKRRSFRFGIPSSIVCVGGGGRGGVVAWFSQYPIEELRTVLRSKSKKLLRLK